MSCAEAFASKLTTPLVALTHSIRGKATKQKFANLIRRQKEKPKPKKFDFGFSCERATKRIQKYKRMN